jgi:UDPglucose 6-dehydrogenase
MSTPGGRAAAALLAEIYAAWVPRERILTTNVWSGELSKLVANAMLAQRVSSINSVSAICEKTDAEVSEVARAVGMDSRIGPKFLKAGIGFGGSCFKKDILNLVYLSEHYGLPEVAEYWEQVVRINDFQQRRFVRGLVAEMFNTLAGKRVAVFGFAFKADTGDTRESPAINVCRMLLEERAVLAVHDPKALGNARRDLAGLGGQVEYHDDPYAAAAGADAIAVLTEWRQFRDYDYRLMFGTMRQPAFIFDGRNLLDHQALFDIGFNVHPLGRPALSRLRGGGMA